MVHVNFYRNYGKTFKKPWRPYEKERIDAELKLVGEYGLRNKRELWRVQYTLSRIRNAARMLLTLDEKNPRRIFEGESLLRRMNRYGLLDETQSKLDYVLALTVENFLERRLQTLVFRSGMAKSIHHARVLIRQRHIRGRREGTRDVVGFGPVVFHNDSVVAIKEGGLHVADLPPLTMDWAKSCRSGMDLSDLINPRQQIAGIVHRPSGGEADPDMQREERSNKRLDLEDSLQPEHLAISSDTSIGRSGTQRKPSLQVTTTHFQIFIKTLEGKSCLAWVHAGSTIMQLKQQIWALTRYPVQTQHLVSGRWSLQDSRTLGSYEISQKETIVLNLRLRGGAMPQGQPSFSGGDKGKKTTPQHQPKGGASYKNILQGNRDSGSSLDQGGYIPRPYIVDQLGETPALNIDFSGIDVFVKDYESQALICRFNSFWPKPMDLFH